MFLVLTAGVWLFKVPVLGNPLVLVTGTLLYLLCTLGIGLVISSVSKTQQQSFLAGFLFIMPAILLSGVMTPVLAMPAWLRTFTYLNPVRYYVDIMRATLLKGAGFADLWWRLLALFFPIILIAAGGWMWFNAKTERLRHSALCHASLPQADRLARIVHDDRVADGRAPTEWHWCTGGQSRLKTRKGLVDSISMAYFAGPSLCPRPPTP